MRYGVLMVVLITCGTSPVWGAAMEAGRDAPGTVHDKQRQWPGGKDADCRAMPAEEGTKLGIIRQMLGSGKPHAAIAYLDAARISAPQADLVRADALRQTGREVEAAQLYRKLLGSCVMGYAYQGLGLVASKSSKIKESVTQLRAASAALPVDPAIRNDYGYALMLAADYKAALHEFLTAIELAPGNRQAAYNLILLLSRSGEQEKAKLFADQFGISPAELVRLQELAQQPLPNTAALDAGVASTTEKAVHAQPVQSDKQETAYQTATEVQR